MEVFLKIVSEVGAAVDSTEAGRKKMDEYFAILKGIKSTKGVESRTRFMIMDVFDLRKKYNWTKPKRRGY